MLKHNSVSNTSGPVVHHRPILHAPHIHVATRTLKRVLLSLAAVYILIVALQLVYPANRSLPGVSFGGYSLGMSSEEEIRHQLEQVGSKTFTARTDKHSYTQSLNDIGISIDAEKITNELADYPLSQRLIPLSVFYYKPHTPDSHLMVHDQAKLDAFASKVAAENNAGPIEGTIINKSGTLAIERSVPGRRYSTETIASYFAAYTNQTLADAATIPFEAVTPLNDFNYLEELAASTTKIMNSTPTIVHAGNTYEIEGDALKRSVTFIKDAQQKTVLDFDLTILASGLEAAADGVFLRPEGSVPGHELDWLSSAEALATALKTSTTASAALKPLTANGSALYPATSKGFQMLIEDWQKSHAGISPVISFSEIGGYGRTAQSGGDTKYFSASVYKVFPAWYLLDQIDQGKLDPNGIVAAGMKLDDCFHDMIIISQSNCSENIVGKYGGWGVIDEFARAHGIEGITLSSGVSITANGMTSFLTKLHNGELLSPDRTTYLLDAMKRQKYRTGFAASGFDVANKVGYQPQTKSWHDAAIMYHPKGTYTLVVLTKQGATLPTLSTLAKQINDTLNR